MGSMQGHFLVASPHLTDPNFSRTVVLIVQHDEQGALGLILNRPTDSSLREIWDLLSDENCPSEELIFHGGPIEGPLTAIHMCEEYAENNVVDDTFFTASKDDIRTLIASDLHPYRVFAGYSGWGEGQLENELEAGGWLTAEATKSDIFRAPAEIWKRISCQIGLGVLAPSLKSRHVPDDPSVN